MAIDPSIALGVKPPQFESPVNMLAQVLQIQGAQQQNRLGQMKLDEHQRGVERTNRLQSLLASVEPGASTEDQVGRLTRGGFLPEARTLAESGSKVAKEQREAEKFQIEATRQKIGLGAQILGSAKDQASYDAARESALAAGLDVSRMPPQFDPAFVQAKLTEALTAQEQLEQHWKAKGYNLEVQKVAETARHNKATVAASRDNANATRAVASATRDAALIRRDQDTEMKLADDYRNQSKAFKETSDAYKQLNATLDKATTSPAATLAGATKFMKLLDPGSVVRESELGMALAATGVLDRAANYVQHLKLGKVLTPAQVADFKGITRQIYSAAQDGQRAIDADYRNRAKTYGLRPEVIIQDLGQNATSAAGAAPSPGSAPSADIDALLQKYGQ